MGSLPRKLLFIPPVLLGALLLWYAAANRKSPDRSPPQELTASVRAIKLAPVSVTPKIRGYGTAQPAKTWTGVAQVGGRIVYMNPRFQQGAILPAGTELIRISEEDYKLAIAEADAQIRSAEAKLSELKVSQQNTHELLQIEKESLALKQKTVDAKQALLKRGSIAQLSFEAELRDLLNQKKKVQDLENALRLLPTQLAVQQEQVRVNQARRETSKLNLERTSISLPFEARIASVAVEISQYVQPGTKIGTADGTKSTEVNAQFPVSGIRSFVQFVRNAGPVTVTGDQSPDPTAFANRVGLHAIVRLKAGERDIEWRGKVDRTNDTLDEQTRTVGVITVVEGTYANSIPGQRPPLVKGMFVEVELRANPIPDRIVIPPSAIHDGGTVHAIDKDGRLAIRKVQTSYAGQSYVVISSGLKAGERIVVSDVSPVVEGLLLNVERDTTLEKTLITAVTGSENGE